MDWRVLAVVAIVALAGCSAPLGGNDRGDEGTVTPAPVPEVTDRTERRPAVAPGLQTTGIERLNRLVRAHVRAARNASWVWTETYELTRRSGNVTVTSRFDQTVRFVGPRTYSREASPLAIRRGGEYRFVQNYAQYADGETGYETWLSGDRNRVIYRRDEDPTANRSFAGFAADPIRTYLALDEATVWRVERGQRQHYRVVGTAATVPGYESVNAYRASALIRADGFVRSLNVTYTVVRPDVIVQRRYSFTYRTVGNLTLERPDWVETARNWTSEGGWQGDADPFR